MLRRVIAIVVLMVVTGAMAARADAQTDPNDCQPYILQGSVRECAANGSIRAQLRTATFIAGSVAAGDTLAQAVALEVATAPTGSTSGGLTFTFDPGVKAWTRTASTFGPAFSERALTIGKSKFSAGFNFLHRKYDSIDGLSLNGFDVLRFQGGLLPVTFSRLELQTRTETVAVFGHYGVLDNVDIGVLVPYIHVSMKGTSRIFGRAGEELQRVLLNGSFTGIGDVAIFGKYRFWQFGPAPTVGAPPHGALAAAATVRLPSGNKDALIGLGVGRTLVSLVGSATFGRVSPHLNIGYEFWTAGVAIPHDFQTNAQTISPKDQAQYSAGIEYELHPRLTIVGDVLGRYLRRGGSIGYQPYIFPPNLENVSGTEALVAIPNGLNRVILAPGAKWNLYGSALLTANVLVPVTRGGLRARLTPVIGIDWGF